jgi:hypothetical protein
MPSLLRTISSNNCSQDGSKDEVLANDCIKIFLKSLLLHTQTQQDNRLHNNAIEHSPSCRIQNERGNTRRVSLEESSTRSRRRQNNINRSHNFVRFAFCNRSRSIERQRQAQLGGSLARADHPRCRGVSNRSEQRGLINKFV